MILQGDALQQLKTLPSESVHCCITSPPYYALRNYGVDGQIGLESTPEAYIDRLVQVFAEVHRALRHDGTLWVNIGDSYAGSWGNQGRKETRGEQRPINGPMMQNLQPYPTKQSKTGSIPAGSNLKPKDMIGIPWMLAFALWSFGWYLRQEIIWAKLNPMPSSVTDRCTTAHEQVFLLSKSERYYFDAEAIKEPAKHPGDHGFLRGPIEGCDSKFISNRAKSQQIRKLQGVDSRAAGSDTRNKRSVWQVPTQPLKDAHFAAFPPKLITPMILAGTSERGCCSNCGRPWVRQVRKERVATRLGADTKVTGDSMTDGNRDPQRHVTRTVTTGWEPACDCNADVKPCTVLDPFFGAGTTGLVAKHYGRDYIGIELNPGYIEIAKARIQAGMKPTNAVKKKILNKSTPSLFDMIEQAV